MEVGKPLEFRLRGSGKGSIPPKSTEPLKQIGSGGSETAWQREPLRPHRWSPAHLAQRVAPACLLPRSRRDARRRMRRARDVASRAGGSNLRRSRARRAEPGCVAPPAAGQRRDAVDRSERHRRARRGVHDHACVSHRRERRMAALPRRRRAHDELRSRVDPVRDQPRGAVPHRRPPSGRAHVELADRRDERRSAHRPRRQRDVRACRARRRAAHPSRGDSRPARPRRHAGRRVTGR